MRRNRRNLQVGADGMADVVCLTNPMPRHLSLVSYGANDRVASSWMSARGLSPDVVLTMLREPPGSTVVTLCSSGDASEVLRFIDETLDAWRAVVLDCLDRPLTGAERASRIMGATSQAAARVTALAYAVGPEKIAAIARSVSEPFPVRTEPTVESQVDRKYFVRAVDACVPFIRASAVEAMRTSPAATMTEDIMAAFSQVGSELAQWAAEIKDGVVGVADTQRAGARHNKADLARMQKMRELLGELLPEQEDEAEDDTETPAGAENSMKITLADIDAVASADPLGFLAVVHKAVKAAKEKDPQAAQKFAWGESGVTPYDTAGILNAVTALAEGGQLIGAITAAVGGIDLDRAAGQGDSPQVAAAMKAAFGKVVSAALKDASNPLHKAVLEAVAPSVSEAITATIKAFLDGEPAQANPAGHFDLNGDAGDKTYDQLLDGLAPATPGLHRPVAARQ